MTQRSLVVAMVLLAGAGTLPAVDSKWPAGLESHVSALEASSCEGFASRHEAQKIFDLLVASRIEDPAGAPRLPLPGALVTALKAAAPRIAGCKDHMAQALMAALQGDFDTAQALLSRKPESTALCGNALAAEIFGSSEALASISFLRGTYIDVANFRLPEDPTQSFATVDVRSSRWALAYAMRATAHEQLGHHDEAIRDSCVAAHEAEEFEESWNYYYSSDPAIWQAITRSVERLRGRLGGNCR